MASIDFWFMIGSTYTYLTVMRIGEIERATGIAFDWRPFNAREIMQTMNNPPFTTKSVKERYMWRDVERRAKKYGIRADLPVPYPLEHLELANKVAIVGLQEGWGKEYTVATYSKWFQQGHPAGDEPNLGTTLQQLGQDPQRVVALANSTEIEDQWAAATASARSIGIVGVPTFAVGNEIF